MTVVSFKNSRAMTGRQFRDALRILNEIEPYDLTDAGIIDVTNGQQAALFARDPMGWVIRADDDQLDAVWKMIQARQPQELVG